MTVQPGKPQLSAHPSPAPIQMSGAGDKLNRAHALFQFLTASCRGGFVTSHGSHCLAPPVQSLVSLSNNPAPSARSPHPSFPSPTQLLALLPFAWRKRIPTGSQHHGPPARPHLCLPPSPACSPHGPPLPQRGGSSPPPQHLPALLPCTLRPFPHKACGCMSCLLTHVPFSYHPSPPPPFSSQVPGKGYLHLLPPPSPLCS